MKKKVIAALVTLVFVFSSLSAVYAGYYTEGITLKYGMNNSNVKDLQNDLKKLGYFSYSPTGYFGSLTKQSVLSYQKSNGLVADGIVGRWTAREIKVDTIIATAKQYLGVPYVWGGVSPSGFDCSGFTHYVFLKNDIIIQRTSKAQYNEGDWVQRSQLRPGDLVFFTTYAPGPSHVGIYLGGGKFIHASSGAGKIIISDLGNTYYSSHYIGAKRALR